MGQSMYLRLDQISPGIGAPNLGKNFLRLHKALKTAVGRRHSLSFNTKVGRGSRCTLAGRRDSFSLRGDQLTDQARQGKNLALPTAKRSQSINRAALIVGDQERAVIGWLNVDRPPPLALRLIVQPPSHKINLLAWPSVLPWEKNYLVSRLAAPVPGSVCGPRLDPSLAQTIIAAQRSS